MVPLCCMAPPCMPPPCELAQPAATSITAARIPSVLLRMVSSPLECLLRMSTRGPAAVDVGHDALCRERTSVNQDRMTGGGADLIRRMAEGDREAFRGFYDR